MKTKKQGKCGTLTYDQVRRLLRSGKSMSEVAERAGVTTQRVLYVRQTQFPELEITRKWGTGRPKKPTACPKCGVMCSGKRLALVHCS